MHIIDLIQKLENTITENVKNNFPNDWDEDFITRNIIKDFRNNYNHITIENQYDDITKINWSGYKLKGTPEKLFGDIALLFNIMYQDGTNIEGVAFIEAKKRYKNTVNFNSIKFPQTRRILSNAPHSMTLFYDYEKIPFSSLDHRLNHLYCDCDLIYPCTAFSYSVIIPSNIIIQIKNTTTSLYKFSYPFSYQLCVRYFNGIDLDFNKKSIDIAKGFIDNIGPKYLLVVDIAHGNTDFSTKQDINTRVFDQSFD